MDRPLANPARGARILIGIVLLGGLGACLWASNRAIANLARLPDMFGAAWVAFALLLVAGLVHVLAVARVARGRIGGARTIRNGFCVAGTTWLVCLVLLQPFDQLRTELAIALGSGVFAISVATMPARPLHSKTVRIVELLAFNLFLTAVLAEISLAALAWFAPSPTLMVDDESVARRMSAMARPIGKAHMGFATNALGHYDDPFAPKEQRKRTTIAMIGDSFSASFVPHHYHFTTVAERELQDIDVYNFGIPGIGPHEYLHLLVHQVLPLDPDAILIGLFAGNDLGNVNIDDGASSLVWPWFNRKQVRLCTVVERLNKLAVERERGGAISPANAVRGLLTSEAELVASYPWLHDHRLEHATFSEASYLELVRDRIEIACAPTSRRLEVVVDCLDQMRIAAGERPFGVVILPAEFQVERDLWQSAVATLTQTLDPNQPQTSLCQMLDQRGIEYLDLLPKMRAATPFADGDRHLYLLRDTHFNVPGNDLAGRAIATFVRELVEE